MNERAAIGAGGGGLGGGLLHRAIEMARAFGLTSDPLVRQKLADLVVHARVMQYTNQRAMDKIRSGQLPGPGDEHRQAGQHAADRRACTRVVAELLGPKITADTGEWGTYAWSQLLLGSPGGRIAGGSDEVMRNIVGERVLGLPKDPGIDSTSPFRDLKVGTAGPGLTGVRGRKVPRWRRRRRRPTGSTQVKPQRVRSRPTRPSCCACRPSWSRCRSGCARPGSRARGALRGPRRGRQGRHDQAGHAST